MRKTKPEGKASCEIESRYSKENTDVGERTGEASTRKWSYIDDAACDQSFPKPRVGNHVKICYCSVNAV